MFSSIWICLTISNKVHELRKGCFSRIENEWVLNLTCHNKRWITLIQCLGSYIFNRIFRCTRTCRAPSSRIDRHLNGPCATESAISTHHTPRYVDPVAGNIKMLVPFRCRGAKIAYIGSSKKNTQTHLYTNIFNALRNSSIVTHACSTPTTNELHINTTPYTSNKQNKKHSQRPHNLHSHRMVIFLGPDRSDEERLLRRIKSLQGDGARKTRPRRIEARTRFAAHRTPVVVSCVRFMERQFGGEAKCDPQHNDIKLQRDGVL